jgi:hypothetical protein
MILSTQPSRHHLGADPLQFGLREDGEEIPGHVEGLIDAAARVLGNEPPFELVGELEGAPGRFYVASDRLKKLRSATREPRRPIRDPFA